MITSDRSKWIVRTLAYILRHHPERFGIVLDGDGFADFGELLTAIRRHGWHTLTRAEVEAAMRSKDPGRFEVVGDRVRATYGYSVPLAVPGERLTPPDVLFHGTAAASLPAIARGGLRRGSRAFVQLTEDPNYAVRIAEGKGDGVVLRVRAMAAAGGGVEFFRANQHVWLVRELGPEYLEIGDISSPLITAPLPVQATDV